MRLVYEKTKREVAIGDRIKMEDDDEYIITGIQKPHKPESTGRVNVRNNTRGYEQQFFPSVIGADWIEREDR